MRAKEDMLIWSDLNPILVSLKNELKNDNQDEIRKLLVQLVPEFKPHDEIVDLLYEKS